MIAVLVVVVLGAMMWAGIAEQAGRTASTPPVTTSGSESPSTHPNSPDPGENSPLDMSRRIAGDPTAMGNIDAPVVLVEYSDFRCPFCALYSRDTQPDIVTEYVEAGLVRLEWRDLPLFGDESVDAAMAARAAGEQGLFWEFQAAIFAAAPERGHAELPLNRLREFAQKVGVPDMDKFERDMASREIFDRIKADRAEGFALGVNSTPTFLVNDVPLSGAHPFDTFRTVIEDALARASTH